MIRKKVYKIIPIMLIIIIFFPYTVTFAATVSEVGNAIANFARKYYEKVQEGSVPYLIHPYRMGHKSVEAMAPYRKLDRDTGTPPISSDGKYYELDCVGWVNFCIYNATGIQDENVFSGIGGYVTPATGSINKTHFETVTGTAKPGDILYSGGHVLVYIANGEGIDSTSVRDGGPFITRNTTRIFYSKSKRISSTTN